MVSSDSILIRFFKCNQAITVTDFTISNLTQKYNDPLEGFQNAFFYALALNIKYPQLAKHVWTFVQIYIFNVRTEFDTCYATVNDLIHELEN